MAYYWLHNQENNSIIQTNCTKMIDYLHWSTFIVQLPTASLTG